jgi:hypothetical protein
MASWLYQINRSGQVTLLKDDYRLTQEDLFSRLPLETQNAYLAANETLSGICRARFQPLLERKVELVSPLSEASDQVPDSTVKIDMTTGHVCDFANNYLGNICGAKDFFKVQKTLLRIQEYLNYVGKVNYQKENMVPQAKKEASPLPPLPRDAGNVSSAVYSSHIEEKVVSQLQKTPEKFDEVEPALKGKLEKLSSANPKEGAISDISEIADESLTLIRRGLKIDELARGSSLHSHAVVDLSFVNMAACTVNTAMTLRTAYKEKGFAKMVNDKEKMNMANYQELKCGLTFYGLVFWGGTVISELCNATEQVVLSLDVAGAVTMGVAGVMGVGYGGYNLYKATKLLNELDKMYSDDNKFQASDVLSTLYYLKRQISVSQADVAAFCDKYTNAHEDHAPSPQEINDAMMKLAHKKRAIFKRRAGDNALELLDKVNLDDLAKQVQQEAQNPCSSNLQRAKNLIRDVRASICKKKREFVRDIILGSIGVIVQVLLSLLGIPLWIGIAASILINIYFLYKAVRRLYLAYNNKRATHSRYDPGLSAAGSGIV